MAATKVTTGLRARTLTASYFLRSSQGRSRWSAAVPLAAPISRRDAPAWCQCHRYHCRRRRRP